MTAIQIELPAAAARAAHAAGLLTQRAVKDVIEAMLKQQGRRKRDKQ